MFNKFRRSVLMKSAGIYTLTNMFNAAIPFFLLPVFTRYLSTEDYGITSMFTVLVGFIMPFIGFNIQGAVSRNYFEKETIDFSKYVYNCFLILVGSSVFVLILILVFAEELTMISGIPSNWLMSVWLIAIFQFINQIRLAILQATNRVKEYAFFQVGQAIMNASFAIIFIVVLSNNWQGTVKAQLISGGIFSLISLYYLYKQGYLSFGINKNYIKNALKFGVPLIPHTIGAVLISMTDRLFITNMVGTSATGIYTVGFQLGMVISLFTDSFNKAWVPYFYGKLKEDSQSTKQNIVKQTYLYYAALSIIVIVFILMIPFITTIFLGPKFQEASSYAVWIVCGFYFNGLYKMMTNYIFFMSKTIYLSIMTFITAILNIGFNYILISMNGAIGAAQATVISYAITFVVTWWLANRLYSMPWNLRKIT